MDFLLLWESWAALAQLDLPSHVAAGLLKPPNPTAGLASRSSSDLRESTSEMKLQAVCVSG